MSKRTCKQCSKEFEIRKSKLREKGRGTFCTQQCYHDFNRGSNHVWSGKKRLEISGINSVSWKGGLKDCLNCSKQVSRQSKLGRCITCSNRFRSGENHYLYGKRRVTFMGDKNPSWKGGIVKQDKLDRQRFTKTMQKLIFERDNYTCQLCFKRGVFLHVDHIKPWSKYKNLRFAIENLRTLCRECHYEITWKRKLTPSNNWSKHERKVI